MSRERITSKHSARGVLLAEIGRLEKAINAEGADEELLKETEAIENEDNAEITAEDESEELLDEAQDIADEEVAIIEDGQDVPDVEEDIVDQNERAQENWPLSASERHAVASRLVAIAKKLVTG